MNNALMNNALTNPANLNSNNQHSVKPITKGWAIVIMFQSRAPDKHVSTDRPFLRIFPDFRNIFCSHFQAAWVTMRRRVTWRLIWTHAV